MSNADVSLPAEDLDVAIIGLAGRFPGARNIEEFWRNLREGVESVKFFSDEELIAGGIDAALLADAGYVKARAVLDDIELFDAAFFGFNPREAAIIDPQHRLFLECAWEAMEHAGYGFDKYDGRVGVYAGAGIDTYLLNNLYGNRELVETLDDLQLLVSNDKDTLTTRVSYKLDLKGPSITVQTSCSSSLVAVHLACQSLLTYQCQMALAGGVAVKVPQIKGYRYRPGGISSPDGHCRAFDARAQGTVNGSGVGVVVLKRLGDALTDGDYIHAVIRGSAINNDGSVKVSYLAPSARGQAAVIVEAQAMAGVEPETISYVEAHGTATALGDPIEIAALTQAFRVPQTTRKFCAIGSVKTNIGHLDTAAGIAGLIKTVLALEHGQLPASLHFERAHPEYDLEKSPFYVNARLAEWPARDGLPRRAGVSSFGIGGTNAHVILEEPPARAPSGQSRREQLLVLSAKTPSALDAATVRLAAYLKQHPEAQLADVAYTLQTGRRTFNHRRALVCRGIDDAVNALEQVDAARVLTSFSEAEARPVAFMFDGQGSQYINMGRELYRHELTFQEQVDRCAELLIEPLGFDLRDVLYPRAGETEEAAARLNQTSVTQPALFVFEYALSMLWMSRGVRPSAMMGHSIGEYVAACLAGVMSLQDALGLVAARGRLMQQLPEGAMLAVELPEEKLRDFLNRDLSLAAVNAPSRSVVSGGTQAVDELERRLTGNHVWTQRLRVSHAFHSQMMDAMHERFVGLVNEVELKPPGIPFISNVTGTWTTDAEATSPLYWAEHLRRTVRFADGIGELLQDPTRVLLEVGAGETLSRMARQHTGMRDGHVVLPSIRQTGDGHEGEVASLLDTSGRLWLAGASVEWSSLYTGERRLKLPLPTYPFERERYWIEPPRHLTEESVEPRGLRKRSDIAGWFYVPSWKRSVLPEAFADAELTDERATWLVFVDECGLGSMLVEGLREKNRRVVVVRAGEKRERLDALRYTINPRQPDDYHALLDELEASGQIPQHVVHLWSVTADVATASNVARFEAAQASGLHSLLLLAQSLGKRTMTGRLSLSVVTNNVQDVTGEETLRPEKATVLAPCKVIPQEYPNMTCRSIDVMLPASDSHEARTLAGRLVAEVLTRVVHPVVAYRGAYRWHQTFEALSLKAAPGRPRRLRDDGVYLIDGGLGTAGLLLAEYLAQAVRAKLILVDREALPAREAWKQWTAEHDGNDACSDKIRRLEAIESLNVEMLILKADVADEHAMRRVMERGIDRFGRIDGVIHAAGVEPEGTTIDETDAAGCAQLFRTHVTGLYVLAQILPETGVDFCLLLSSLSSILGGLGHVAYASANLFMDAFAHERGRLGRASWTSVNWETWGVGEEGSDASMFGAQRVQLALTDEELVETFRRILTTDGMPQVIVSTDNLEARIEQWINPATAGVGQGKDAAAVASVSLHARPQLRQSYVAPESEAEKIIAALWQEMLGIEAVGVRDNFFELGGDSLLATRVASSLRETFNVKLPLRNFFEAPTVRGLAALVSDGQTGTEGLSEIDLLLREIESLSIDEVRARLSDED